jgi:hypothetical protein
MTQSSQCHFGNDASAVRSVTAGIDRRRFLAAAVIGLCHQALLVDHAVAQVSTPASGKDGREYSRRAAVAWLAKLQLPDGGFPGPSGESEPETTIDAVMAAYSLGIRMSPSDVLTNARTYLLAHGPAYAARGAGQAAQLVLAAIAMEEDPRAFGGVDATSNDESLECENLNRVGGVDLVALMTTPSAMPLTNIFGIYGSDLRDHALVLIAHGAMYDPVSESALEPLSATQTDNGGWAVEGAADPALADAQTTALILQALAATDLWEIPLVPRMNDRGLGFLQALRIPDSGVAFAQTEPLTADAVSTAMALQALIAAGEDLEAPEWSDVPVALARFWSPSGGFRLNMAEPDPNIHASLQAIPAMEGQALPVRNVCD